MKLENIQAEWDIDSIIDINKISSSAVDVSKLHSKYYRIYMNEVMQYRKLEQELKVLRLEKYEFLTLGATEETKAKGWTLPPQGKILKNEVQMFLDADRDIIEATLRLGLQKEKVDFVESVIRMIQNRNFSLKTALDFEKFKNGL